MKKINFKLKTVISIEDGPLEIIIPKQIKNKVEKILIDEQNELCYKLRIETGLGLMACKKCLIKHNWNYDEAKKNYKDYQWDGKLY